MVRLTEARRAILADKAGDLANYAVAALVFGQAVGEDGFSVGMGLIGFAIWLLFMGGTFFLTGEPMTTALFMLGLIALTVFGIGLWDWLARRKDRQSEHRRSA